MKGSLIIKIMLTAIYLILNGCEKITSYPDTPSVKFKAFNLYRSEDILGNQIFIGKLEIDFTDGNGDIGMNQTSADNLPDSLKYNLFLSLYEIQDSQPVKIEGTSGELKYRLPYIERTGQNKTLKGTIQVDIEYKTIDYDSIMYTFYLLDREYNRSNTDTTRIIIFTGLEL